MDFNGRNNRYGQVAVPDFIEHLALQAPDVLGKAKSQVVTQLRCSQCRWVSHSDSSDILFKLYIPFDAKSNTSLSDLWEYNSLSVLSDSEAVFCGKCNRKTTQTSSRECSADTLLIEIMRVNGHGGGSHSWSKNSIRISFPTQNLKLSKLSRSYRVIASCHHRGSIKSGHWTTKVCTSTGTWYELDDLNVKPSSTNPPGISDSSVTVLLLIAEDKLI